MTCIKAKLKYKQHAWTNYNNGSFCYSFCDIDYKFKSNDIFLELDINISTMLCSDDAWLVFSEILDFLYLAFGTMPEFIYYKENGMEKDLSNILSRYFPSVQFFKAQHLIDISDLTFNEHILTNIKNTIRNKPFEIFWAFTALTSKAYEHIYAEHKIVLLLHCFEGYIYNKNINSKKSSFKNRISEIVKVLFDYEKQYDTNVLKTLSLSEEEYLTILTDTRHQFSHYMSQNNSLSTGLDYIINFVLLHYVFRVFLLKEIKIQPKDKNVIEFLKSVSDWINILKDPNFKDYKSVAYSGLNFLNN